MFSQEDFIDSLTADPIEGTIRMVDMVGGAVSGSREWDDYQRDTLIEACILVTEILEADILQLPPIESSSLSGRLQDCPDMWKYLQDIQRACQDKATNLQISSLRSRIRAKLGTGFIYEFSQGDLDRVQHLINELREQISKTSALKHEHQQRLLRRLEKLQAEMHKKVSDLDRFWGLIGDAGVIFGKLGNDAKPFVDRIKEIANIVWQTQSRAEELPSGTRLPSLEHKPHESVEEI